MIHFISGYDIATNVHLISTEALSLMPKSTGEFLAAMSSSRSYDVTKCVCPFVVILSDLEHLKHLKQEVSRVFQGSFKGVSRKFQGCFTEASRVFHGSFKCVSRKFQGSFTEVSRVLQGSFKGVSRKFQGCFKEVSRVFHESFNGSFKDFS